MKPLSPQDMKWVRKNYPLFQKIWSSANDALPELRFPGIERIEPGVWARDNNIDQQDVENYIEAVDRIDIAFSIFNEPPHTFGPLLSVDWDERELYSCLEFHMGSVGFHTFERVLLFQYFLFSHLFRQKLIKFLYQQQSLQVLSQNLISGHLHLENNTCMFFFFCFLSFFSCHSYHQANYQLEIAHIPSKLSKSFNQSLLNSISLSDFEFAITFIFFFSISSFFNSRACGLHLEESGYLFTTNVTSHDDAPWLPFTKEYAFDVNEHRHLFFLFAFPINEEGELNTDEVPSLTIRQRNSPAKEYSCFLRITNIIVIRFAFFLHFVYRKQRTVKFSEIAIGGKCFI